MLAVDFDGLRESEVLDWPATAALGLAVDLRMQCTLDPERGDDVQLMWTVHTDEGSCGDQALYAETGPSTLVQIPASTFVSNLRHVVAVTATVTLGGSRYTASASVRVHARPAPLAIAPLGGGYHVFGTEDVFALEILTFGLGEAAGETCPGLADGDAMGGNVHWACVDEATELPLVSRGGGLLQVQAYATTTAATSGSEPGRSRVAVPAALAPAPETAFACNVTAQRVLDGRSAATNVRGRVSNGLPPSISLSSSADATGGRVLSPASRLTIESAITPGSSPVTNTAWSARAVRVADGAWTSAESVSGCPGLVRDPDDVLFSPSLLTPAASGNLAIAGCSLAPGHTFTFTIEAWDSQGSFTRAQLTADVNSPPRGGVLALDPPVSAGPLDWSVSGDQSLWTDDAEDLPLRYAYALRVPSLQAEGVLVQVARLSLRSAATLSMLPPGNLQVVGEAVDAWGAAAHVAADVVVIDSGMDGAERASLAVKRLESVQATIATDPEAALASIALISSSLPPQAAADNSTGCVDAAALCNAREELAGAFARAVGAMSRGGSPARSPRGLAVAVACMQVVVAPAPLQLSEAALSASSAAVDTISAILLDVVRGGTAVAPSVADALAASVSSLAQALAARASPPGSSDGAAPVRRLSSTALAEVASSIESAAQSLAGALAAPLLPGEAAATVVTSHVGIAASRAGQSSLGGDGHLDLGVALAPSASLAGAALDPMDGRAVVASATVNATALPAGSAHATAVLWRSSPSGVFAPSIPANATTLASPTMELRFAVGGEGVELDEGDSPPVAVVRLPVETSSAEGTANVRAECVGWGGGARAGVWSLPGDLADGSARCGVPGSGSVQVHVYRVDEVAGDEFASGVDGEDVLHTNDVSAQDVQTTISRGPTATSIPWIIVGVLNAAWIIGFLMALAQSCLVSKQKKFEAHAVFHRKRHAEKRSRGAATTFMVQQWKWIRSQHKLIRAFVHVNRLNDDNKFPLSPYQKVAVVTSIITFKLLACSLLYRGTIDEGEAQPPTAAVNALRVIVTAVVASLLVLPASFLIDRLFVNQQYVVLSAPRSGRELDEEVIFAAAAFEALMDSLERFRVLKDWRSAAEAMRITAWAAARRERLLVAKAAALAGMTVCGDVRASADAVGATASRRGSLMVGRVAPMSTPASTSCEMSCGAPAASARDAAGGAASRRPKVPSLVLHDDHADGPAAREPERSVEADGGETSTPAPSAQPTRRSSMLGSEMQGSRRESRRSSFSGSPKSSTATSRRSSGRGSLSLVLGPRRTKRGSEVWPSDDSDAETNGEIRGPPFAPHLLFRSRFDKTHAQRASACALLRTWARAAGVGPCEGCAEGDALAPSPVWTPKRRQGAHGSEELFSVIDQHVCTDDDDDDDATSFSTERDSVPFEWLVLLALHRKLARTCCSSITRVRGLISKVESASVGVTANAAKDERTGRYIPSPGVRRFWTALPWVVVVVAFVTCQLYIVTILETHLEPKNLTREWLTAGSWAIVQGWLIEPGIIVVRNNVSVCARNRTSKIYQLIEQFGCGVFVKVAKAASKMLD